VHTHRRDTPTEVLSIIDPDPDPDPDPQARGGPGKRSNRYNFSCMTDSDSVFDSRGRFWGQPIRRRHCSDRNCSTRATAKLGINCLANVLVEKYSHRRLILHMACVRNLATL